MPRKTFTVLFIGFGLMALTACDPSNVDPEALEYHRANREAYLYQGL
ncbi:hypothetical protein [Phaeobacter sp. NW0010-22]